MLVGQFLETVGWDRERVQMAYSILLVDDDADSREIVARLLEADGHHVEMASHGAKHLALPLGISTYATLILFPPAGNPICTAVTSRR